MHSPVGAVLAVPPVDEGGGGEVAGGGDGAAVDGDGTDVPAAVLVQPAMRTLEQVAPQSYAITLPLPVRHAPQQPLDVLWGRVAGHEPVPGRLPVASEGRGVKFWGHELHGEFWQMLPHVYAQQVPLLEHEPQQPDVV